ncbi:MAG TPA: flagellar basal body-associated FliL family protein [Piscirickettsiaceae bacterium]|nr:flagellar basal body-associated FliL family protein [Piscirickettsiaceae bacterium]HIQ40749.1 flagellar basal body-associated FliL family protein [Sulfurivirga caldicuralii]
MAEEEQKEKSGGGNTLLIVLIIILFIFVLALGGAVAWLLLSQGQGDDKGEDKPAHEAPAEHGEDAGKSHAKQYSPKYKQFEPPPENAPPQYFEMNKFIVNILDEQGREYYLAVDIKVMTYYPQVVQELEHLRPILRSKITKMLRRQVRDRLIQPDGQDYLEQEILKVIREVAEQHNIYPDLIEGAFLERFVMQRAG